MLFGALGGAVVALNSELMQSDGASAVILLFMVAVLCAGFAYVIIRSAYNMKREKLRELDRLLRNTDETSGVDSKNDEESLEGLLQKSRYLADAIKGEDEQIAAELSRTLTKLSACIDALKAADRELDMLMATAVHDLRSPMTSVMGFVEGMLDGTIPQNEQEKYLRLVSDECHRLSGLISELLDVSRAKSGSRSSAPTAFDICELTRQVLIGFELRGEEKRLEVLFESSSERLWVWAVRTEIHRIIHNLIDNAIKYSALGSKIEIHLAQNGEKVTVQVLNQGRGLSAHDIEHIFDPFYRACESDGEAQRSTGLGLYLCRLLAEANSGRISADGRSGEWASFTLDLCAAKE